MSVCYCHTWLKVWTVWDSWLETGFHLQKCIEILSRGRLVAHWVCGRMYGELGKDRKEFGKYNGYVLYLDCDHGCLCVCVWCVYVGCVCTCWVCVCFRCLCVGVTLLDTPFLPLLECSGLYFPLTTPRPPAAGPSLWESWEEFQGGEKTGFLSSDLCSPPCCLFCPRS